MTASAPRYDPRILAAARELDDPGQSMAETCRRVGVRAEGLGLPRPSYVHLRRLIVEERERRAAEERRRREIIRILGRAYWDLTVGRFVHPYELAEEIREAGL